MFKKLAVAVNVAITASMVLTGVVAYASGARDMSLEAELMSQLKDLKLRSEGKTIQRVYKPAKLTITEPTYTVSLDVAKERKITPANVEQFPQVFCLAQNIYFEAGIERVIARLKKKNLVIQTEKKILFDNKIRQMTAISIVLKL